MDFFWALLGGGEERIAFESGEDKIGRSTTFSKGSPSRTGELSLPRWHWLLGAVVPKDDRLQPNGCMH